MHNLDTCKTDLIVGFLDFNVDGTRVELADGLGGKGVQLLFITVRKKYD
jgi:hypothetical protein